jgi:hypothetical protein
LYSIFKNNNTISNSDDDYELELKTPMVVQWVMKMMGIMTVMMKTIQMKIINKKTQSN